MQACRRSPVFAESTTTCGVDDKSLESIALTKRGPLSLLQTSSTHLDCSLRASDALVVHRDTDALSTFSDAPFVRRLLPGCTAVIGEAMTAVCFSMQEFLEHQMCVGPPYPE